MRRTHQASKRLISDDSNALPRPTAAVAFKPLSRPTAGRAASSVGVTVVVGEMVEDCVPICGAGTAAMLPLASWRDERRRRRRWSRKRNWFSSMVRRISGTEMTNAGTQRENGANGQRVVEQLGGLVERFNSVACVTDVQGSSSCGCLGRKRGGGGGGYSWILHARVI